MGIYKKKPVEIQAFQLGVDSIPDWAMHNISQNKIILHKENPDEYKSINYADVVTLEGTMRANHGDYIIQGVNGEVYPCKEDIFIKTYDYVSDDIFETPNCVDNRTEKEKLKDLFAEAYLCGNYIITYTMFDDDKTIETTIYNNNLESVFQAYKDGFDDNLENQFVKCKIIEAVQAESLADYFSDSCQEKISNRIYDKTGIRI